MIGSFSFRVCAQVPTMVLRLQVVLGRRPTAHELTTPPTTLGRRTLPGKPHCSAFSNPSETAHRVLAPCAGNHPELREEIRNRANFYLATQTYPKSWFKTLRAFRFMKALGPQTVLPRAPPCHFLIFCFTRCLSGCGTTKKCQIRHVQWTAARN